MRENTVYILLLLTVSVLGYLIVPHTEQTEKLFLPKMCTQACPSKSTKPTERRSSLRCEYTQKGHLKSVFLERASAHTELLCFVTYTNYTEEPLTMNLRLSNGTYQAYKLDD